MKVFTIFSADLIISAFWITSVLCFNSSTQRHQSSVKMLKATSPMDTFLENIGMKKPITEEKVLKIAVTGSSGFVGSALIKALNGKILEGRSVEITRIVRKSASSDEEISWNPSTGEIELEKLENFDSIVHLAGEGVASGSGFLAALGRWDEEKKNRILDSRVNGTATIVNAIKQLRNPPKTFICSSGVGYYGYDSGDEEFDENSENGKGFLAEVTAKWEAEALRAQSKQTRVICLRTGVVLEGSGGVLAKLLPIFRLAAGGNIGSGQQYFSWISLRDLVSIVASLISSKKLSNITGAVNACSPNPCTNGQFTRALGLAVSRPAIFPIPEFIGNFVFGQMGEEMLFGGQRVIPKKLMSCGYQFMDTSIEQCLADILN